MNTSRDFINQNKKIVLYQVFTRLFGNKNKNNKPWGTIEENGIGKFSDFTIKALREIKNLGVTHIWYTGVLHHALVGDYTAFGISNDNPQLVKGRAGSPYAIKDYYNVNPDLAINPAHRKEEFEALIKRTHKVGLKLIIDIVPNHVARKYEGKSNPKGVRDFGIDDDVTVEYSRNNNFYYIPNTAFEVPDEIKTIPGDLVVNNFNEFPAKWTGNGFRNSKPNSNDWYETVKINFGIQPNGTKDFDLLPNDFYTKSYQDHFDFWKDKNVPDTWVKFRDIALYWCSKGIDGFRYDMAEMVPVEFWSYMNSYIKTYYPKSFLLAEVYNPSEYRNYIHLGKMDYLYDKVGTYDYLKAVIQGREWPDGLSEIQYKMNDIEHQMLKFLENHDEYRLASKEFTGSPEIGKPMMVVSSTISSAPIMIYFGQEVGEAANEGGGFGEPHRTSIFDYVSVPSHQRWMNEGKFDGGQLNKEEKELRNFYKRLLNFSLNSIALTGNFADNQNANRGAINGYDIEIYSFARWCENEKLLIIVNFSSKKTSHFELKIGANIIQKWSLQDGNYILKDQLYEKKSISLEVINLIGKAQIEIKPLESFIYKLY